LFSLKQYIVAQEASFQEDYIGCFSADPKSSFSAYPNSSCSHDKTSHWIWYHLMQSKVSGEGGVTGGRSSSCYKCNPHVCCELPTALEEAIRMDTANSSSIGTSPPFTLAHQYRHWVRHSLFVNIKRIRDIIEESGNDLPL
jgi:hypothetical protein